MANVQVFQRHAHLAGAVKLEYVIGHSQWTTFQLVQENVIRGGQSGRSAQGRRLQSQPVGSIDRGVSLNRALWMLAEELRKLKV
jgi:hypothetical protein